MRGMALVVALSVGACSTTATIHRAYGPAYEAEIVTSDPTALRVLGDDGRLHEVSRAEVTDIDHPGNVVLTVGAILAGLGALVLFSTVNDNNSPEQETGTVISLVYGLPGLVMMIGGGVTYFTSKSHASAFETGRFPVMSRPPQVPPSAPLPPPWPPPAAPPTKPAPPPSADEPQVVPAPAGESPR